jgi:hypothetical protein
MGPVAEQNWFDRIPDSAFFAGACVLFLSIALAMSALAGIFSGSIWSLGDTRIFFRMADLILQGGTPYVDFRDPKPPLIFFLLAVPQALGAGMAGGLLLTAIANFVSAAAVMKIGWRLYGRGAGLAAGLLFVVNIAWAQGYFVLTEPFVLSFMLLSVWLMLSGGRHGYLMAGISAGLAIGFKQYALLIVPIALFYALRKGEAKSFLPYIVGVVLPLLVVFAGLFATYGADAGIASLYWSFGVAPTYFTEASIEEVTAYQIGDPAEAAAWVALAMSLFAPLVALAAAGAAAKRRGPEVELFIVAAVAFAATLVIRPFLHYWALALPFAVLLAAGAFGNARGGVTRPKLPGAALAVVAGVACTALLSAAASLTYILMSGTWRPQTILEFYGLADIVLSATVRYFGHLPEPAAVAISIDLPSSLMLLAAFCTLTAIVVIAGVWRLYGRTSAMAAGALFTASIAFALGYMLPSDGLALLLLAISACMLLIDYRGSRAVSGLVMGTAVVIKPFAVVLALAAVIALYRSGKASKIPGFIICFLAPVALFSLMVAGSPEWGVSWGVPISGSGAQYVVQDSLLAMLNLAAAGSFTTLTAVAASAAFLRGRAGPAEEFLLLASLAIFCTLAFGEFLHYWFIALPFATALCARLFAGDQKVIITIDS